MKKVLVTGSSGFIGFHVVKKILDKKIMLWVLTIIIIIILHV